METENYTFSFQYEELEIGHFIKRYHFDEKDRQLAEAVGRFLAEFTVVQAGICYLPQNITCAVTLGSKFDKLAELAAEHLLLSYCIECYGMEFLSKAYEKINVISFQKTGKWIGAYHFLEEEDIEETETALSILAKAGVTWEQGMLRPLKSVIFTAEYTENKEESGCDHCTQCGNVTCTFRKEAEEKNKREKIENTMDLGREIYSYGISNIFGRRTKI